MLRKGNNRGTIPIISVVCFYFFFSFLFSYFNFLVVRASLLLKVFFSFVLVHLEVQSEKKDRNSLCDHIPAMSFQHIFFASIHFIWMVLFGCCCITFISMSPVQHTHTHWWIWCLNLLKYNSIVLVLFFFFCSTALACTYRSMLYCFVRACAL